MTQERIREALEKTKNYVDGLTIHSKVNVPAEVVADELKFFTWDNEKRTPSGNDKPYLFDWSYYNGVVMEGLVLTFMKLTLRTTENIWIMCGKNIWMP